MTERFRVGVITSAHGLHGEVKVYPTTDDPHRFSLLKEIILDQGNSERVLRIRNVRYFKNMVILKFDGLDRIEDIQAFLKKDLLIDRKDALPLAEGEYYIPDLIGLNVIDEDSLPLGQIVDVLKTAANDVYVVRKPDGKEFMIPKTGECILDTDPEAGIMKVHLLPGLLDL
ncbi:MAG: 16S rRNA processing protein RimM [Lachnospiraceae bacterium]|nr:16S rRNA processing protein RimM [Lachnospiraceae bacterium]